MESNASSKRRRTSPDRRYTLKDLPDNVLSNVAECLPQFSRVLFAVATMIPTTKGKLTRARIPSLACLPILPPSCPDLWETLDLAEVERSLAGKLTDDDIDAILCCIDATTKLKTLKLTGCVNITGIGLDRLRHSNVLEQLDLSLVGANESPIHKPEPKLSEADVLPILESIVNINSFKQLQLPHEFRKTATDELDKFLCKWNRCFARRQIRCSECNHICQTAANEIERLDPRSYGALWVNRRQDTNKAEEVYGLQNYTCYQCTKSFCQNCRDEGYEEQEEMGHLLMQLCNKCEKNHCRECAPTRYCHVCYEYRCRGCGLNNCAKCDETMCKECTITCKCCSQTICKCQWCNGYAKCANEGCNKEHCLNCFDDIENDVARCNECNKYFCFDCQLLKCSKDLDAACLKCVARLVRRLAKMYQLSEQRAVPGKCACWDRKECIRCNSQCQKKGCNQKHCDDCGVCDESDISWCDVCYATLCFRCHVNSKIKHNGYCCRGCAKES